jgi:hypothetical protein
MTDLRNDVIRKHADGGVSVPRHAARTPEIDPADPGIGMSSPTLTGVVVGISLAALATATVALVGRSAFIRPPTPPTQVLAAPVKTVAELSLGAPDGARRLTEAPLTSRGQRKADASVVSRLATAGIPLVALEAYRAAAARIDAVRPDCHLTWQLLAGIGGVETNHGQARGATLGPDGESTPHIIGQRLDGKKNVYIADTDQGTIDADASFDRGVGPFQFIPSTWIVYGADATGDGVADPFNINDAALGAARYLCSMGKDLATAAGQQSAVTSWNHGDQYVSTVVSVADRYSRTVAKAASGPLPAFVGTVADLAVSALPPPASPGPALALPLPRS